MSASAKHALLAARASIDAALALLDGVPTTTGAPPPTATPAPVVPRVPACVHPTPDRQLIGGFGHGQSVDHFFCRRCGKTETP